MRLFLIFIIFVSSNIAHSQESDTSIARVQELPPVHYDKYLNLHYSQKLNQIRRTYPIAVRAKEILDSLDMDLAEEDSKRKQKRITKERKQELKDEFTYLLKDLYIGEGAMLFKLIHRETGMSVSEILEKYKGKLYAKSVETTFALYGHDTDSHFDAEGDDWISEMVIQDIISGRIKIDMKVQSVSKDQYKDNLKEYRKDHRAYKKAKRG